MKHLNASGKHPSGNPRLYYRPKGQKGIPLPDLDPNSIAFKEAYIAAAKGEAPAKPNRVVSGTIEAGVRAYLASDIHHAKAASTRALERRLANKIIKNYGTGTLDTLRPRHIRLALADLDAHAANNMLKVWRACGRFWLQRGFVDDNPAKDVTKRETNKAQGAAAWTREDFDAYRAHWPIGTPQRLAFELFYQTCAAVVDVVQLGPANMREACIAYRRQKSKVEAVSPTRNAPAWFEASGDFWECLNVAEKHMTFLTTQSGASRSGKSTASWFSKSCTEAGLPGRSAHGIRKGRAAMFKENGASVEAVMAILGHKTPTESREYSKSADLLRVITGTESSNSESQVGTFAEKANKNKGA